jgi:hypothetical protein
MDEDVIAVREALHAAFAAQQDEAEIYYRREGDRRAVVDGWVDVEALAVRVLAVIRSS